ncbi:MAG: peptide chain release factor 2 [Christensenellales bacterium]|nr:peptide chain release factor 2 [Clostridiales bacterium]
MIDFYYQYQTLDRLKATLNTLKEALDIDSRKKELSELEALQEKEGFWNDIENAQKVNRQINAHRKKIDRFEDLDNRVKEFYQLLELIEEMQDEEEAQKASKELTVLEKEVNDLRIEALLKGKYDNLDAILTLHAGAGGTEAQDWADMLYRMYTRYAERKGYQIKELDFLDGDEAGIKSVTFQISGENAYGYLKAEKGVHRLVRISPFDANKRRHTSFASLEVMPIIEDNEEIKINPDEIRVDTYRSGGAGGQHVNKTDSAIRITHLPTGIVVQCQNERSQLQNKETAMKMLISKLAEKREREKLEESQSIKGDLKKIEWGSQIRSYVFCPYTLVKDHRTGFENTDVNAVMDGDIEDFILEYLKRS